MNLNAAPEPLKTQCLNAGVPAGGSGDTGLQELAHVGGNAKLQPETAKIFTTGVVIEPQIVRNLSFTVDYYNIKVDNLIGTVGVPAILAGCYPTSGTPVQDYCSKVVRAPGSGRILFVEDFNQNVGDLTTEGIDFAGRYAIPSSAGRFSLGFDANWLLKYDRTQSVGTTTQTIHGKGTFDLGALPTFKGNLVGGWSLAGFTVGATGRYIRSFKECAAADLTSSGGLCYTNPSGLSRETGDYATLDLNASYTLASLVGRTVFLVGVNNVFDPAPKYAYAAPLANSDPSTYDFVGRFVYGRLQHTF